MILEPCAARAARVAHNPPLDRQASWHQCLTECQRVEQSVSTERAKREALQQCHDIQPQEREAATVHEPPGRGFHSLLSELWGPRYMNALHHSQPTLDKCGLNVKHVV